MTKYFIHIFFILLIILVIITVLKNPPQDNLPPFVTPDKIVNAHKTNIYATIKAIVKPSSSEVKKLKNDYAAIWGHLNHLYNTNDMSAGKEYYTADFFKAICHKTKSIKPLLNRTDIKHHMTITNWSKDGIVCVGIDSNVLLKYTTTNNKPFYTKANIAFALLLQGEHWRIDALEFLNEENIILE